MAGRKRCWWLISMEMLRVGVASGHLWKVPSMLYMGSSVLVWGCVYVLMCIYAFFWSVSVYASVHMGTQAAILSCQSPALMPGALYSSHGLAAHLLCGVGDCSFSIALSFLPSSVRLEILASEICLLIFPGFWRGRGIGIGRAAFCPNPFWKSASLICIYNGEGSGHCRAWDPLGSFYSDPMLFLACSLSSPGFLPWVGTDGSDLAVSGTSEALLFV